MGHRRVRKQSSLGNQSFSSVFLLPATQTAIITPAESSRFDRTFLAQ